MLNLFINKLPFAFAVLKAPTIVKIKPKPAISKIAEISIKTKSITKDFFWLLLKKYRNFLII